MKDFTKLFNKVYKEANTKTQYDDYWKDVVKNANNVKKPEYQLVAAGAWYVLSTTETPIADMKKMLALDSAVMQKVRTCGEVVLNCIELAKPKSKAKAKPKAKGKGGKK